MATAINYPLHLTYVYTLPCNYEHLYFTKTGSTIYTR